MTGPNTKSSQGAQRVLAPVTNLSYKAQAFLGLMTPVYDV